MPSTIKKVKSLEVAGQNKYGNDYWEVVWDDDKKDKVFDFAHFSILEEAKEGNLNVEIEKEKKGQYWNIKNVKLVASSETVKEIEKQGGKLISVEDKMTKEDWAEKDRLERQSIHRQKASDIGTRWCSTIIGTGTPVSTKQMMDVVKMLEHYYETGE